jgi:hypothetical protein
MSTDIYSKACALVNKNPISNRHTFYQLKHFVLGKEVTIQSKLQKCLREVEARKSSMKSMILSIDEAVDEIRTLEIKEEILEKKKEKSELHKEYKEIQKRKLARKKSAILDSIFEMKKKLTETEEETEFFLLAYQQLEQVEPLKRHDDPESNAQYWNENFAQELQLRLLLQKPLDLDLVKCILALNPDSKTRKEMIGILDQIQKRAIMAKAHDMMAEREMIERGLIGEENKND